MIQSIWEVTGGYGGAGYDSYDPYSYEYTYYKGKKGIPQVQTMTVALAAAFAVPNKMQAA